MPFTGFYQPLPELRPITPTVNPLQQEFHKMAQDFIANTQKQQQLNLAEKEQQVAQLNAQTQRQAAMEKAKLDQEKRQKALDESLKRDTVFNAVKAKFESIPTANEGDKAFAIASGFREAGLEKDAAEVLKPYEKRFQDAKNLGSQGFAMADTAYRAVTGQGLDKAKWDAQFKAKPMQIDGRLVSPDEGVEIFPELTKRFREEKAQAELAKIKAEEASRIKVKQTIPGKAPSTATPIRGGITPAFAASINSVISGGAPEVLQGQVPGEDMPAGVGMGQPGTLDAIGFGVDPSAGVATRSTLQGQALIDALVAKRPLAVTAQDNKYLDDLIRQEERKMAASGKAMGGGKEKLSPGAARDLAERVHSGGMSLSQAARGDEGRALVSNALHQIYVETGDTPAETDINGARFAAGKRALADNTKRKAFLEGFAETARANGRNAILASREYARSGIPWANAIVEAAKGNFSPDKKLARFQQFNTAFALEMANILNNPNLVGVTPESLKRDILEMLSTADSPEVYEERINAIFREMNNRLKSFRTTEDELIGGLRALGIKPAKPGDQIRWSPSETPKPLPAAKEDRVFGQLYYTPDGQRVKKWMGKGWAKEAPENGGAE